ncbi:MAG: adenosylcobinamide-GDP ribazoletransferase [Chloroflexota bacterium]
MSLDEGWSVALRRGTARGAGQVSAALAMLTRIPVPEHPRDLTGAAAYGLVGALVRALGGVVMLVLGGTIPTLAAILAVATMAVVAGGIHLDGLADTMDALLASDAGQAERARKDPAIGSGGAVTLVLVLGAQVAALAALAGLPTGSGPTLACLACIAAGSVSRALPVLVVQLRGGALSRGGLGSWFVDRVGGLDAVAAALTAGLVIALTGLAAGGVAFIAGATVGAVLGIGIGLTLIRARRQLDGDVLGATVELGFAAVVGALAVTMSVTWPIR